MLAEYGLDHVHVCDRWTMAQMRAIVRRLNERIEREREAMEAARDGRSAPRPSGQDGTGTRQQGLTMFCMEEKRRGNVRSLRRRSERLKRQGLDN